MRITIDTKEDSVHEIKHIVNLLQQILGRQNKVSSRPSPSPNYPRESYFPAEQTRPSPPQPSPPLANPFSMFDAPSIPSHSSEQRMAPLPYTPPQEVSQATPINPAPNIFDIFGQDSSPTTTNQSIQENDDSLFHYDAEQKRKDTSDYTFTTY